MVGFWVFQPASTDNIVGVRNKCPPKLIKLCSSFSGGSCRWTSVKKKNFYYVILKNRRPHAYDYDDIQYNSIHGFWLLHLSGKQFFLFTNIHQILFSLTDNWMLDRSGLSNEKSWRSLSCSLIWEPSQVKSILESILQYCTLTQRAPVWPDRVAADHRTNIQPDNEHNTNSPKLTWKNFLFRLTSSLMSMMRVLTLTIGYRRTKCSPLLSGDEESYHILTSRSVRRTRSPCFPLGDAHRRHFPRAESWTWWIVKDIWKKPSSLYQLLTNPSELRNRYERYPSLILMFDWEISGLNPYRLGTSESWQVAVSGLQADFQAAETLVSIF